LLSFRQFTYFLDRLFKHFGHVSQYITAPRFRVPSGAASSSQGGLKRI
jgi:hypothetical protein